MSIPRVLAVSQSEPNSDLVTARILQQLLPKNDQCVRLGGKKMIKRNHREEMEEQKMKLVEEQTKKLEDQTKQKEQKKEEKEETRRREEEAVHAEGNQNKFNKFTFLY